MISAKLDQLADYMIRPRRRPYKNEDLGPKTFKSNHGLCQRKDFQVQFHYGQTYGYSEQPLLQEKLPNLLSNQKVKQSYFLKCSFYCPISTQKQANRPKSSPSEQRICVLAMHGNTGSRMSTISLLQPVLKYGLCFAIFDFLGCGNSDGEHVTLGYSQKHQISAVLDYLHKKFGCHRFILHGRSMGAASSLFYCAQVYPCYVENKESKILSYYQKYLQTHKTQTEIFEKSIETAAIMDVIKKLNHGQFGYEIIGLIVDSPYYDTKQMFLDIASNQLWFIPKFLVNYIISNANERVKEKLEYMGFHSEKTINSENDLHEDKIKDKPIFSLLDDIKIANECEIPFPVFVIYGFQDDVISREHTFQLFKRLICEHKKLHIIEDQGHGGHRDDELKMNALQWILGYEFQRVSRRLERDAHLLGMNLDKYIEYTENKETFAPEQKQLSLKKQVSAKQRQKSTQNATQRTYSQAQLQKIERAPKNHEEYVTFASSTSLNNVIDNENGVSFENFNDMDVDKLQKLNSFHKIKTNQNYANCSDKFVEHSNIFCTPKKMVSQVNIKDNFSKYEGKQILGNMSRINPHKELRAKMGVTGQYKRISYRKIQEENNEKEIRMGSKIIEEKYQI